VYGGCVDAASMYRPVHASIQYCHPSTHAFQVEALLSGYYGPGRLQQIRRALATAPNHTCLRVNTLRQPASDMLAALQAEDGPLQQAWGDRLAPPTPPEISGDGASPASAVALTTPVPYLHPTPPLSQDTILVPSLRAAAASEPAGIGKDCLRSGTHVVVVDRCVFRVCVRVFV
jgi:hypothetical protein